MINNFKPTITATLWEKTIKVKSTGNTFQKTLIKVNDTTFECILSKDTRKKLVRDGVEFPMEITFNEDQYFVKEENTTTKDGELFVRQYVVLTGYEEAKETTFTKKTIEDAIKERELRGR